MEGTISYTRSITYFVKRSGTQGAGRIVGNFVADRKYTQILQMEKESARTIDNPVSFSLHVLAKGNELQVFHALGVTGRRRSRSSFMLLMLIVNNAPSAVDNSLDV